MGNAIRLSKVLLAVLLAAALFIQSSNMQPVYADECYTCESDFDNGGAVDGSDLAIMADEFGETNCCTGISADAIYVSNSHPAAADIGEAGLTPSLPVLSISYGILRAAQTGRAEVRVAAGLYEESVTLQNGISLLGGYDPNTWLRNWTVNLTMIKGSTASGHRAAVTADCTDVEMFAILEGFVVFGENADSSGENSYGIYIKDCTGNFVIRHNVIRAGAGGDGTRGDNGAPGSDGAVGGAGTDALDLYEAHGVVGHECTAANHSAGGSGGVSTCGAVVTSGGDGGNRVCPDFDGTETAPPVSSEIGQDGLNGGGSGGAAGRDVFHQAYSCEGYQVFGSTLGEDGQEGPDGIDGIGGSGCSDYGGDVSDDHWVAYLASGGGDGTTAGGGGGGGSGAGAYVSDSCYSKGYNWDNLGGTGGGGGSGGCGANAGTFGFGGGGSFGMFVVFTSSPGSVPDISNNVIHTADGGKGGDGGNGGVGGTGGAGGSGGAGSTDPYTDPVDPVYPSLPGGHGGSGGNGGHGGGGGGGCGGVSYGIYAHGQGGLSLSSWASLNTFHLQGSGGSGGYGGASFGNPGGNGQTGAAGATNF
jgi:hypothetical protein